LLDESVAALMTTATIHNPVPPGFHPDPSILRVGEDFYLATSTFEWWPGVRLHHSRDLVHWRPIGHALTRTSQLEMRGNPDSGGIWAPCPSWHDGLFHLIYTNVSSMLGAHKDTHNHLVTAPAIDGPWSEPVYLNGSGFDPSLFHDDDGRSWLLNMQWDHRPGNHPFCGILLQQYDRTAKRLVGTVHRIFLGTSLAVTEGPHPPLLTARGSSPAGPQRAGHASIVDTGRGEWYLAHLCGRPVEWRRMHPPSRPRPARSMRCTARWAARPPCRSSNGPWKAGFASRMATTCSAGPHAHTPSSSTPGPINRRDIVASSLARDTRR
jgi:xylan 1,4-beta-xylosidase